MNNWLKITLDIVALNTEKLHGTVMSGEVQARF